MPSAEHMTAVVQRYVAALNAGDLEAIMALYASDASVEDPVGSPPKVGQEQIRAFYAGSVQMALEVALQGEVRVAGDEAAFAFTVGLTHEGQRMTIAPIDHLRFNAEGQIVQMRAFFGAPNIHA